MRLNTTADFWDRVDCSGGDDACWPWLGTRRNGYGRVRRAGRVCAAHRVAWALTNGPIPEGRDICHTCDNPPCCNPAHLRAWETRDNIRDCIKKGRHVAPAGEAAGGARLTAEQVRLIRLRYTPRKVTQVQLAREYGVTVENIQAVLYRRI